MWITFKDIFQFLNRLKYFLDAAVSGCTHTVHPEKEETKERATVQNNFNKTPENKSQQNIKST